MTRVRLPMAGALLLGACSTGHGVDAEPRPERRQIVRTDLGRPPLCEPSASLRAPWDADTVIVADNEQLDLFTFFAGSRGRLGEQADLPTPAKNKPRDVEALAASDGGILVVGSYSRSSDCEDRPKRRRLRLLSWDPGRRALVEEAAFGHENEWGHAVESVESCLGSLFQGPAEGRAEEARAVCAALVTAEREAAPDACATLNIEGAVTVSDGAGVRRTWLGLRSPLVEGRAVLLRLSAPLTAFRFDAVALLDLGGWGVRELAARGAELWGIAGPVEDREVPFLLWRAPVDQLRHGARLNPVTQTADLPSSSEGLVFEGATAIVTIDGRDDEGDPTRCRVAPAQARVALR